MNIFQDLKVNVKFIPDMPITDMLLKDGIVRGVIYVDDKCFQRLTFDLSEELNND